VKTFRLKTKEEKTIVCSCNRINYQELKDAVKTFGTDYKLIQMETTVGTVCGQCMSGVCDIVDLPVPLAIEKAKEELNL
jgi:bacterioferritin-associated ferredoxin